MTVTLSEVARYLAAELSALLGGQVTCEEKWLWMGPCIDIAYSRELHYCVSSATGNRLKDLVGHAKDRALESFADVEPLAREALRPDAERIAQALQQALASPSEGAVS